MPELPEVETVRRDLEATTRDREISHITLHLPRLVASPDPDAFCQRLQGRTIRQWQRRGKYLWAELDDASLWVVHLRMTGQFLWQPSQPPGKHTRAELDLAGSLLRFDDLRTFGQFWWLPNLAAITATMPTLANLGPEPLTDSWTVKAFATALHNRKRPIKTALLDQDLVAGIGNIYADESLFLSHILPTTLCKDLSLSQIERLHQAIRAVLSESIALRGTSFSNYRDLEGVNGNYLGKAWVYRRTGQPCRRCPTGIIERIKLGGRSTHFCPVCQDAEP